MTPATAEISTELADAMREEAVAERTAATRETRLANARELLDLPPGIHDGVPDEVYHARCLGLASKSALDWFAESPAKYVAWANYQVADESTRALEYGRAFHMAVLEPERFARTYLVEPDFGPCRKTADVSSEEAKVNKTRRDAWRKAHQGGIPITAEDFKTLTGMSHRLRTHKIARPLLVAGHAERVLRWDDPATGIACKAKGDYELEDMDVVIDLKSCADASEAGFTRAVGDYGYHDQEAFYRRGYDVLRRPLRRFIFVCCEKTEPYEPGVYDIEAQSLAVGEAHIADRLARLAQCIEREEWPGYSDNRIVTVSLPPWKRIQTT